MVPSSGGRPLAVAREMDGDRPASKLNKRTSKMSELWV